MTWMQILWLAAYRAARRKEKDPFYGELNMAQLERAEEQIREGKVVVKTMEELESMELA